MNEGDMLSIRVPASTANLGPGFDSVGLALNLYLHMEVERSDRWEMIPLSKELEIFPKDESNYTFQVAIKTAEKYGTALPPCRVKMKSDIPLARGLGSSAAVIIAGIELANAVGKLNLSDKEKFLIATEIEGHPDNVGASLYGGLVIASKGEDEVDAVVYPELSLEFVAVVPREELLTKDSRSVLPGQFSFRDAVRAGSIGNVLVGALLTGDYSLAGKMMRSDLYHQPYRRKFVPHFDQIEEVACKEGAFGVCLSGAGPTVLCCCEKGKGEHVREKLAEAFPEHDYLLLRTDRSGSVVNITNCVK